MTAFLGKLLMTPCVDSSPSSFWLRCVQPSAFSLMAALSFRAGRMQVRRAPDDFIPRRLACHMMVRKNGLPLRESQRGRHTSKNAPSYPEVQVAMEGRMSLTVDLVSALPVVWMDIRLGTLLGMLGVAFVLASVAVKRMATLRSLSLAGSVCFIIYGFMEWQFPSIALNLVLIPLNAIRLWEITRLSKEIEPATENSPVEQWLLPHAQRRAFRAGEVLFRKGDPADRLIYVARGELTLAEIGQRIGPAELIGEIGLFAPDRKRT